MPGADVQTYRVLRRPEVLELTGLSAATVYRWIAEGRFPPPVRLGPNSVGWRWSELQEWLETRERALAGGAEG
jgi:prophage regulatory protein